MVQRRGDGRRGRGRRAPGRGRRTRLVPPLPDSPCTVAPYPPSVPASTPPAYRHGSLDGSRPGTYFVNTAVPSESVRHKNEVTSFHEAVPGHHFEVTNAESRTDLPLFRRTASVTAYREGWALYSERLADEMGLYSDDLARAGHADDGLHPGRPARRRHRPAPQGLVPPAGHRLPAGQHPDGAPPRPVRSGPLPRRAGAGAGVHGRPAGDPAPAPGRRVRPRRLASTSATSTRPCSARARCRCPLLAELITEWMESA